MYYWLEFSELVKLFGGVIVGLYIMIDEYFGIVVVEYMVVGVVFIGKDSIYILIFVMIFCIVGFV